jgi:hypothetical protein
VISGVTSLVKRVKASAVIAYGGALCGSVPSSGLLGGRNLRVPGACAEMPEDEPSGRPIGPDLCAGCPATLLCGSLKATAEAPALWPRGSAGIFGHARSGRGYLLTRLETRTKESNVHASTRV